MAWDALTDAETAAGQAVTQSLMRKVKDNFDFFYGQSASSNTIPNGSYEIDADADGEPDSWSGAEYNGGTFSLEDAGDATAIEGSKCIKFTHPGGSGNGGGYRKTDDYVPCVGGVYTTVGFSIKVSATGAKNQVVVEYYDEDQVTISSDDTVYNSTTGPTSWTPLAYTILAPATARFYKIKVIGGLDDTDPGAARDTYFDHVWASGFAISSVDQMGADTVGQSQMRDSAIGQAECKTTTGEVSTSTSGLFVLPGGEYGFYPQVKNTSVGGDCRAQISSGPVTTSYVAYIYLAVLTFGTAYAQQRYFQASPPYDLGDGEIPLFLFCKINKSTGLVESIYSAPEAPWHYNGPTKTNPDFYIKGKPFKRARSSFNKKNFDKEKIIVSDIEITQDIKNADMNLTPHPFLDLDPAIHAVALIDPVADMVWKMREAFEGNYSELHEMLYNGDLKIDNVALSRSAPVACHAVKLR